MSNVLFLRAPSQDTGSLDRYESTFTASGYRSSSVPVLETVFMNMETVTDIVRHGGRHGAVIVTSARACEAWGRVVDVLEREHMSGSDWSSTPFYVVGKSTASVLNAIGSAHPHSRFAPTDIRGESSGTSEQLARFILKDLESTDTPRRRPLLYLTGDKNRDTLPGILRGGNIQLDPLQVYQTQGSSTFAEDLKVVLEASSPTDSGIWWIVFFAPSAAEFVTPFLRDHFDLRSLEPTSSTRHPVRIASIGPTTSTFLRDKLNLWVDAVALKPTPEDLIEVISAHDKILVDRALSMPSPWPQAQYGLPR
ncbi:tetrapyrrole biosynthesis, uroporphyrinogen III synthase [Mycena maculata]|uniref:Tetrapyrrole biosynthesis, uroporphyrinogen III synthase n=1 Tax=Mycena maculata TaxID=230809 RepID=A0AAD7HSQ2_9AGAR|nr:tetrapyrrole biosynthesis, uroporphyrinogen III synthase [Mycena maculata]